MTAVLLIGAAFLALAGLACGWAWLICLGRGAERLAAGRRRAVAGISHNGQTQEAVLLAVDRGWLLIEGLSGSKQLCVNCGVYGASLWREPA